jgi:hypothetical protein
VCPLSANVVCAFRHGFTRRGRFPHPARKGRWETWVRRASPFALGPNRDIRLRTKS